MKKLLLVTAAIMIAAVPVLANERKAAVNRVLRVPHEFKTIQRALDDAESGDTVFVDEGTYKEAVTLRDDVVLTGVSAERTIIQGSRRNPVVRGAQGATIRNVTVEGGQMGILAANTIMTIENCVIRGNRGSGIHCLIALPVIRNNIIFRNAWSGVFLETTRSHKGHISNNVIAENNYSGVMLAGQSEALIEGNVFYFNKQYGVFTAEGARKSRIVSNSFFGNRQAGSTHSVIDNSNMQSDPGYTTFSAAGYTFWERTPDMLKGKGRNGSDIGAVRVLPYKPSARTAAKPAATAPIKKTEEKKPVKQEPKPAPVPETIPAPVPEKADDKSAPAKVEDNADAAEEVKTEESTVEADE